MPLHFSGALTFLIIHSKKALTFLVNVHSFICSVISAVILHRNKCFPAFFIFGSSGKGLRGPWLLFVSESGYGKRVPLSRFRMSALNRTGLIGYKVCMLKNKEKAEEQKALLLFFVSYFLLAWGWEKKKKKKGKCCYFSLPYFWYLITSFLFCIFNSLLMKIGLQPYLLLGSRREVILFSYLFFAFRFTSFFL